VGALLVSLDGLNLQPRQLLLLVQCKMQLCRGGLSRSLCRPRSAALNVHRYLVVARAQNGSEAPKRVAFLGTPDVSSDSNDLQLQPLPGAHGFAATLQVAAIVLDELLTASSQADSTFEVG
jgi:hypothetical protein